MNTDRDRRADPRSDVVATDRFVAIDRSGADLPATFPATCDLSIGHDPVPIGSGVPGSPPEKMVCLFCDAARRIRAGDLDGPAFDGISYPEYVDRRSESR